jgi:hypothetical protein
MNSEASPARQRRRRTLDHPARPLARIPCVCMIARQRNPHFHRITQSLDTLDTRVKTSTTRLHPIIEPYST